MSILPKSVAYSHSVSVIIILGFFVVFESTEAADECHFEEKGKSYCHYGCCKDRCCPLTTAAMVALLVGSVVGLASLVGCLICLSCMLKQQTTVNRSAVIVHPLHNKTSAIYNHNDVSGYTNNEQYGFYAGGEHSPYKSYKESRRSSSSSSSPDLPESKIPEYNSDPRRARY